MSTQSQTPPGPAGANQEQKSGNPTGDEHGPRSEQETAGARAADAGGDSDAARTDDARNAPQDKPKDTDNASKDAGHDGPAKDDPGAKKRFLLALGVGAIALFVLLMVGLVPRLRAKPALDRRAKENARSIPEVDVVHPTRGPQMTTLQLPGNIDAVQDTDITARATGYVSKWLVDIGDQVRAGQVLAVIDTPEVDQQVREAEATLAQSRAALVQQRSESARAVANLAQARQNAERQRLQLVQAQADLSLAQVTADRWLAMVKEGAVSQQSADEKVAALRNNQANVAALKSAVAASRSDIAAYEAALRSSEANIGAAQAGVRASQANLDRIRALRNFREVRAPFSGVVTARNVDAGSLTVGGGSGSSSSGGGAPTSNSSANNAGPSAPTGGQGSSSARRAMYGSTPDTGIAGRSGGAAAASGSATASGYGDSQAAAGGAAGSAGANGATGNTAGPAAGAPGAGGSASRSASVGSSSSSGSESAGGAAISPGVSLYHIAKMDVLRIQVNVPQSFAPSVQVGSVAKITVREYAGREFLGKVTRTARSLDPQTRTMQTEVQIANGDKRLLPGMYAQVQFSVSRPTPPLVIPAGALLDRGQGTQVATVGENGHVHLQPVTVGRDFGQQIEVTEGLKQTDWIVTDPSDATAEGAGVQAITPEEKKRREQEAQQQQAAQGKDGKRGGKSDGGQGRGENAGQQSQGGQGQASQGSGNAQGNDQGSPGAGQGNGGGGKPQGPPPNLGQSYGGGLSGADAKNGSR